MIGHRKFAWKVENLPPSEWFDLDRSEEMPDFDPETQQNTPIFDDDDRPQSCPSCHSANLVDRGDVFEREHIIGTQFICKDCQHAWVDEFGRDWEHYE